MTELCKTIFGNRGCGKSVGLEVELLDLALRGEYATLVLERPGSLARNMVGHLSANGLEKRTLIEIAEDTKRVLRWPFIQPSKKTGLDAERENELEDERFGQPFWAKRGLKSGEQKPYTKRGLDIATALFRSQKNPIELKQILDCFKPGTKEFEAVLDNSSDEWAVEELHRSAMRSLKSPIQFETEMGASQRLLMPVKSPVVNLRHGTGINWRELLEKKYQIYFDLSNITAETARLLAIFATHAAINTCRQYFDDTGKPLPLVIVLEEAGALDLVTPFVITAMQELRKCGVVVWIVSQTIMDFEEDMREQLLALSDCHYWYRMNSGIERAANDLADPTFDPLEVHYTRERIVSEGFTKIETKSKGKSKDPSGKPRETEHTGVHYMPNQRIVVDEYYKTPQVHVQEFKTGTATLQVGYRYTRDMYGVRKEHVDMLPEPFALGLTKTRTEKAIERIRSQSFFTEISVCGKNQKSAAQRLGS